MRAVIVGCGRVGAGLAAKTGVESPESLARLVKALPDGCLSVDLDPGALVVNGHMPLEMIQRCGEAIRHVHARDGIRDAFSGRAEETALDRGIVDFPALLGALEEHAYRGYFTLQRSLADGAEYELGQGVKYLRNLAT